MRTLAALLAALLATGCLASTDIETMTRPNWQPETFERVVVYYASDDLEDRKQVEDRFAEQDSAFIRSYELFFPGQSYSMDEIREIMDENNAEAALVLNPKGAGSNAALIPGQTTTTCTGNTCRSTGGPIVATFPEANFGAALVEWETEQTVWAASAESGGNAFADQGNLRKSFVDSIIDSLREDGLLSRRE